MTSAEVLTALYSLTAGGMLLAFIVSAWRG